MRSSWGKDKSGNWLPSLNSCTSVVRTFEAIESSSLNASEGLLGLKPVAEDGSLQFGAHSPHLYEKGHAVPPHTRHDLNLVRHGECALRIEVAA